MQKLTHRLSDRRPPKPSPRVVLCVGESGGTVGLAISAAAPAICPLNATCASAPTPTPVKTITWPSDRTQSQSANRLLLRDHGTSSERSLTDEHHEEIHAAYRCVQQKARQSKNGGRTSLCALQSCADSQDAAWNACDGCRRDESIMVDAGTYRNRDNIRRGDCIK